MVYNYWIFIIFTCVPWKTFSRVLFGSDYFVVKTASPGLFVKKRPQGCKAKRKTTYNYAPTERPEGSQKRNILENIFREYLNIGVSKNY